MSTPVRYGIPDQHPIHEAAALALRGELLDVDIPRHFKDLLQRMLSFCEAGLTIPRDYREQYMAYHASKQRQNKYGQ